MGALRQDGLADETVGRNITLTLSSVHTRVEAGSNTSTVTLRVVGGDEKGSLKTETVKYCNVYMGYTSLINYGTRRLIGFITSSVTHAHLVYNQIPRSTAL
jgi:hypothetical protein